MNSEENESQKLPDGWILCQSKSSPGRRYFFNLKTGKSSWTHPLHPQDDDDFDQKKQKGKNENANFRDKKKKIEIQKKILKRKSDGEEDSLCNKKQRPESTPEVPFSPSPGKPTTPAKYTEPKPIDIEPCIRPILTKNIANTRLSQLRARLSSEASLSTDGVDAPSTSSAIPRTPAPFTEQKSVSFDLKSPPLNEFKSTARTPPSCESLQSPSPSQFLAANKILSSMKSHLPNQFRNMRPKDTFADIEEGICNQTTEQPFMKNPAISTQFSEASKLVSAIKSKLSYTPKDHRDNTPLSFMSNTEYVDKIKSFIAAKEQAFRIERSTNTYSRQDEINPNNVETRTINTEDQMRTCVSNKEKINCRNDKLVTCIPNIRPTDPRQDKKLSAFISDVRHLNDIENNKQKSRHTQEHINFSEYKARKCKLNNRNHIDQTKGLVEAVKTDTPITQIIGVNQRSQTPSTSFGDNGKTPIHNLRSHEHNLRTQVPNRQSTEGDSESPTPNRRGILINTKTPVPNRTRTEGDKPAPITNRRSIENDVRIPVVRIPISDRLKVDTKLCTIYGENMEEKARIGSNNKRFTTQNHKISTVGEKVKVHTQSRLQNTENLEPVDNIRQKTEVQQRNHLPNQNHIQHKLNNKENTQETLSEPMISSRIQSLGVEPAIHSTPEIEKQITTPSPIEEHENNKITNANNIMSSIEEELEKLDHKSPQNQNLVNHMKEEDSLELDTKSSQPSDTDSPESDESIEEFPSSESSTEVQSPRSRSQSIEMENQEIKVEIIESNKVSNLMSDDSIISLISDDSSDGAKETENKSEDEVETFSSAKDRMESLRNRLSKEAELTEITDVEYLNNIKLPSPNVITDEEYLNMIELPKYPCEAMEVDSGEDRESTSNSCPKNIMDPNMDIVLVVDTNIFIHELDVIKNVLDSHIKGYTKQPTLMVPWRVVNELDRLKDNNNGNGSLCKRARDAMDYLYKSLPENNRIKGQSLRDSNAHIYPCESPDDEILNCCLQEAQRGKSVILLSNDKNLCNKATINEVRCIDLDELRPLLESKQQASSTGPNLNLCATVKHIETVMYSLLAAILENEMRAKYQDLWHHVIFKTPPWSLMDVLQCLLKHWIAVFNEVFPRIEHLLTDMKNTVECIQKKDPRSLTQSEVANFKELCLEIAQKCLIIPEYMGLAKATVERLHREPSVDETPEMAVIEAFEKLWMVFSSYCAQLCAAVGLECTLEDKLGGAYNARLLGERWPVYSAQLYALTLAIKGSLWLADDKLTEEQVDELEDVFKECLALVEMDGSKVNKDNIRVFCTKCRNMLEEAASKFCGLTELLNLCKQRMESL